MTSAFSRFPDRLQSAITSRLGWTSLCPVQELAGHAILDDHNTIVLAPTAGERWHTMRSIGYSKFSHK